MAMKTYSRNQLISYIPQYQTALIRIGAALALFLCFFAPMRDAEAGISEQTLKIGGVVSSENMRALQIGYSALYRWEQFAFGFDSNFDVWNQHDDWNDHGENEFMRFGAALITRYHIGMDPTNFTVFIGPGVQFSNAITIAFLLRTGVELTFRMSNFELGGYVGYDFATNGDLNIHYGNFGLIFRFATPKI